MQEYFRSADALFLGKHHTSNDVLNTVDTEENITEGRG